MAALSTANVVGLTTAAVAALGSDQVAALSTAAVGKVGSARIGALSTAGTAGLSAAEVGAQIGSFKSTQIAAIGTDAISGLFFNDAAAPEISTLSLHDALPISSGLTATQV